MDCFSEFDLGKNYKFYESVFEDVKKHPKWKDFENLLKAEPERMHFFNVLDYGHFNSKPEPPDRWIDWKDDLYNVLLDLQLYERKLLKIKFAPKNESWNWLTISPRPMLTDDQLDDFESFVRAIFCEDKNKYFSEYCFVIECGKNPDKPNYHLHALYHFKNTEIGKNFKRNVSNKFDRMFNCEGGLTWTSSKGRGWFLKTFKGKNVDPRIIQDKRDYCINSEKSFLHENFKDLGINGSWKLKG